MPSVIAALLVCSSTTASTSPAATWAPGVTSISVTTPACGALTVCCIFIASSTSTVWPAVTSAPTSTATLTTVPGIGASSEPLATASAGSVNRGTAAARRDPRGDVDVDGRPRPTVHVVRRRGRRRPRASPRSCGSAATTVDARRRRSRRGRRTSRDLVLGRRRRPRTVVRCGCGPRCARRPGCRAGRCGAPAGSASASAAATARRAGVGQPRRGHLRAAVEEGGAPPRRPGTPRRAAPATSRSRLVSTPWIRALASASASWRAACVAGRRPGDHLGEHRVVVRARPRCRSRSRSRAGCPAVQQVELAGDPRHLERGAACRSAAASRRPGPRRTAAPRSRGRRSAPIARRSAACRPSATVELQLDQVDAVHQLGDRVLDLEPGVHLQEEEAARVVGVDEELDGAGADVVDRRGGRARAASCSARRGLRRRARAPATPRRPSGGGAGSSSPARRAPARRPACRRRPAPRRGGRARRTARRRRCRRRTRTRPRRAARRLAGQVGQGRARSRMPRPPPPADALTSSGRSASVAVSASRLPSTGTPAPGHQLLGLDLGAHLLDRLRRRARPR